MTYEIIEQRMNFLESLGYDKHFYARFKNSEDIEYELFLRPDKTWIVRNVKSDVLADKYPGMTKQQIIQNLECLKIDTQEVFYAVSQQCLQQVNYADLVIREATKIFGIEVIEKSRKNNEEFHSTLVKTLKKLLDNKEVIDGKGETTPKKTGHLTVVKT